MVVKKEKYSLVSAVYGASVVGGAASACFFLSVLQGFDASLFFVLVLAFSTILFGYSKTRIK